MPCWTIEESKVEFLEKSTDMKLLKKALEAIGYRVQATESTLTFIKNGLTGTYFKQTGEMRMPLSWKIETIKRAYSEQVVEDTAEQMGWQLDWETNLEGNREATVQRRN